MFFHKIQPGRLFLLAAILAITAAAGLLLTGNQAAFASDAKTEKTAPVPHSFTDLAKKSSPAVVNISTVQVAENEGQGLRNFFRQRGRNRDDVPMEEFFEHFFGQRDPRQFQRQSLGSGFILDEKGHIVTNNHVIKNAEEIKVKLKDGEEYDAELIGTDPSTDIALIKIETETSLPSIELGDSEELEIGQWVLAIGNPFGLDHTVTAGIVSAKGRVIGAGAYDDFIQTDASINPGNSGGPLIDMKGKVVGINTAIVAGGDGIGFAIPVSMAIRVIDQLKETGEVTRGWIGVGIQEMGKDLQEYYDVSEGVLITEVFSGEPAEKAGIKKGDIVTAVNGESIDSPRDLSRKIANIEPDTDVTLSILRDGEKTEVTVTVAKRDEQRLGEKPRKKPGKGSATDELGLEVVDIDRETADRLGMDDTDGVIVAGVAPDSKAFEAGFARGDIIREIDRQPVRTIDDYERIIEDTDEGDTLSFYIVRPREGIKIIRIQM